jgi:poly-gamma-glutamate synthesis protein (capsule biosynthesis protein)
MRRPTPGQHRPSTIPALALLVLLAVVAAACGGGSSGGGSGDAAAGGGKADVDEPSEDAEEPSTTIFVPRIFSIAASGDILLHAPVIASGQRNAGGTGYDFNPMFDQVRDQISAADLALCHQETPVAADNKNLTVPRTLSFNAPREIAPALANAGFDGCDTASNHTWDRQLAGLQQTNQVLEEAGLEVAGGTRSQQEADTPPIHDVKGVKVGHLAFSYTIYNNAGPDTKVPAEAPWLETMLWPAIGTPGILEQARALKARGAEFVVVSMHWGDQYVNQPNAKQRELAKELLASPDIDVIIGDHVHVVQPCEKIGEEYVTYGMGNFLSNQSPTQDRSLSVGTQDGTLQRFDVAEVSPGVFKVLKMTYQPTWVQLPGHQIQLATPTQFKDSYDRTVKNMNLLGPGACDAVPAA